MGLGVLPGCQKAQKKGQGAEGFRRLETSDQSQTAAAWQETTALVEAPEGAEITTQEA